MSKWTDANGYDFHCHIDLYPDPVSIISQCERSSIVTLAVTTTPQAWLQNKEWADSFDFVFPAVGLHPELVGERFHELELLEQYLRDSPLIGEVGLDGSPKYRNSWEKQKEVFARVLQTAQKLGNRVISIHSRRAAKEVVDMIETLTTPDRVLCILHWFSGSEAVAQKAISLGCYFSVNGQMIGSRHGATIARNLPYDSILTETDGPFSIEDKRKSIPTDILMTAERLSDLREVSREEMNSILLNNSEQLFKFAGISKSRLRT